MNILFVCKGNVGRSQMAEALFKQINNKHKVSSAGTTVVSKEGESRDGQMLKEIPEIEKVLMPLREKGIEIAENTRTQLTPGMVEWADKIVVTVESEFIPDYLKNSSKVTYWDVKDPKGTSLEEHVVTMNQIGVLVRGFIEENSL